MIQPALELLGFFEILLHRYQLLLQVLDLGMVVIQDLDHISINRA